MECFIAFYVFHVVVTFHIYNIVIYVNEFIPFVLIVTYLVELDIKKCLVQTHENSILVFHVLFFSL
jgi:hypothetical protein